VKYDVTQQGKVNTITSDAAVATAVAQVIADPSDPATSDYGFFTDSYDDPKSGFSREELILMVELAYTLFEESGQAPTYDALVNSLYRATPRPKNARVIFKTEIFKAACSYRGIPMSQHGLTNKQMLTLRAVTNQLSRLSLDTKLKRLGVTQAEYKAWLRYPPFKRKLTELSENALKEAESAGDVALAQQVTQGRLDAIKYADLRSGKYDPGRQVTLDVEYVMRQMIEIIQRYVKDPATLRNIGGELSLLAGAAGLETTASAETNEVTQPDVQEGNVTLWQ